MEPLRELSELVVRHVGDEPTGMGRNDRLGLRFTAWRAPLEPAHHLYEPAFGLVVRGEKRIVLGDQLFTCRQGHILVSSVDLPVTVQVPSASPAQPFVAVAMTLQPARVASLLLEAAAALDHLPVGAAGMGVSEAPGELLEAVVRLVRLLDHPRDLPLLGPLAEREILWRLLCSEQGQRLRQIGLADSRLSQLGRAMRWMREHYQEDLRIEDLARLSAMSVTSFHRHFRAVARMSPLQYLKHFRLQEARARLLAGGDVASVGHAVGYDSPSQFSREYKRAYGSPPGQDARSFRASVAQVAK